MIEPEKLETGIWRCPVCGFTAMSKKVVEAHIQREHLSEARSNLSQDKPKVTEQPGLNEQKHHKNEKDHNGKEKRDKGKNGKKGRISKRSFKLGKTEIRLWDYEHIDVKDQRSWQMYLNRNYIATLHKKRVKVKLITGEEFEGIIKTRDPYFVTVITDGGGKVIINKAHILWVRPLGGGQDEK